MPSPDVKPITGYTVVARIPDLVASLRFDDRTYGHIQLASIIRDFGIDKPDSAFDQSAVGWGFLFTGCLRPLPENSLFNNDKVWASISYGNGISAFNSDLTGGGYDAAINAQGEFVALPSLCYYVGYTHYWTTSVALRSTIVFSSVELDGVPSLGDSSYHRGDYIGANLVYQFAAQGAGKPTTPNKYNVMVGLEYLYGQKETFNGAKGHAHEILLSVAVTPY
jgi:hypothetical protein